MGGVTMISFRTIRELVGHFAMRNRLVLIPLLVVLLLAAILLVLTNGLSVVAPFVYALF
ncbi:MAG: hypothetical protein JNM17_41115 [Archangium sp.]|nr:hypothetical protein [Archangium sp.]